MTDVFPSKKRSEVMSRIRGSGNKDTELVLISVFKENKIVGWRRRHPIFGKPDFVFPKSRIAVFVDGCFWHGCTRHSRIPKSNIEFWQNKIEKNKSRDRLVTLTLKASGWIVIRIWEHELKRDGRSRLLKKLFSVMPQ